MSGGGCGLYGQLGMAATAASCFHREMKSQQKRVTDPINIFTESAEFLALFRLFLATFVTAFLMGRFLSVNQLL